MKVGYKKNKVQQLRLFCAVIEEGTILKAAEKFNTAQPNVSLQITSLEKDLQVKLFKREKQRLKPTPEALRFYKMCKKTIEEMDFLFSNAMQTIKHDNDNTIKLAGHFYMLSHILPPYFKRMIEKKNDVRFELHNTEYEETIDLLNAGTIDFAIFPADSNNLPKNIEMQEFYKCKFGIGMHKDHPLAKVPEEEITWNLLSEYDYITIGNNITTQGLKAALTGNSIKSKFKLFNGTWEICTGIMKEGLAISGTDEKYASWHSEGVYKACPHLIPEHKFHVLTNTHCEPSNASKQFLHILNSVKA
jgi:DNA-binding transcriptional LysR family regulator